MLWYRDGNIIFSMQNSGAGVDLLRRYKHVGLHRHTICSRECHYRLRSIFPDFKLVIDSQALSRKSFGKAWQATLAIKYSILTV